MSCSVYSGSSNIVNIYNNTSFDLLKVSSLNEDLREREEQLAAANNEVIILLRVFDYWNWLVQFTLALNCNFHFCLLVLVRLICVEHVFHETMFNAENYLWSRLAYCQTSFVQSTK